MYDPVEKWVCDRCFSIVTEPEIADMGDGVLVLCVHCCEQEREREERLYES